MRIEIVFIACVHSQQFLTSIDGRSAVFDIDECGQLFSCLKFPNCDLDQAGCGVAAWVRDIFIFYKIHLYCN